MIPLRVVITQHCPIVSRGPMSARLTYDVDWAPGAEPWAAMLRRFASDARSTGLNVNASRYELSIFNASVPDCESEPRAALINETESLDNSLLTGLDAIVMLASAVGGINHAIWRCDARAAVAADGTDAINATAGHRPPHPDLSDVEARAERLLNELAQQLADAVAEAAGMAPVETVAVGLKGVGPS